MTQLEQFIHEHEPSFQAVFGTFARAPMDFRLFFDDGRRVEAPEAPPAFEIESLEVFVPASFEQTEPSTSCGTGNLMSSEDKAWLNAGLKHIFQIAQ